MRYIDPCLLRVSGLRNSEIIEVVVNHPPWNVYRRAEIKVPAHVRLPKDVSISYSGYTLFKGSLQSENFSRSDCLGVKVGKYKDEGAGRILAKPVGETKVFIGKDKLLSLLLRALSAVVKSHAIVTAGDNNNFVWATLEKYTVVGNLQAGGLYITMRQVLWDAEVNQVYNYQFSKELAIRVSDNMFIIPSITPNFPYELYNVDPNDPTNQYTAILYKVFWANTGGLVAIEFDALPTQGKHSIVEIDKEVYGVFAPYNVHIFGSSPLDFVKIQQMIPTETVWKKTQDFLGEIPKVMDYDYNTGRLAVYLRHPTSTGITLPLSSIFSISIDTQEPYGNVEYQEPETADIERNRAVMNVSDVFSPGGLYYPKKYVQLWATNSGKALKVAPKRVKPQDTDAFLSDVSETVSRAYGKFKGSITCVPLPTMKPFAHVKVPELFGNSFLVVSGLTHRFSHDRAETTLNIDGGW